MTTQEREFRYLYRRALKENDKKLAEALYTAAYEQHGWDLEEEPV